MLRSLGKLFARSQDQLQLAFDTAPRTASELLVRLKGMGLTDIDRCRLTRNRAVMVSYRGRELRVDTDDPRLRARFAEAAAEERAAVVRELATAGVAHVALSTDRDWLRDLAVFVRRRRA